MPRLGIVVVSVREGRVGESVANWVEARAREHAGFQVELVDLKVIDLPLMTEPNHPRLKKYSQPKTLEWSARIESLDAFVFVTPEYNFSTPAPLANALDYLYSEWGYKAAALVSYGGISGGLRGAQMTKQRLSAFNMMTIVEAVSIPFVAKQLEHGQFVPSEAQDKSLKGVLDELLRWTTALDPLRRPRGT